MNIQNFHVYTTALLRKGYSRRNSASHTTQISRKKTNPTKPNEIAFCFDSLKVIPVWLLQYFLQKYSSNINFPIRQLANETNFSQVVTGTKGSTVHAVLNTGISCHLKRLWVFEISALCWQI